MKKKFWGKTRTYLILMGVGFAILLLELLVITILDIMDKGEYINDTIAEGVVCFICFPGIIIGIIGATINALRKK